MGFRAKQRLVLKSKVGDEFTFENYKGETVTKRYLPFMVIGTGDNGFSSVLVEREFLSSSLAELTIGEIAKQYFINVFDSNAKSQGGKKSKRPVRDEQDDDADGDDLFGDDE